MKGNQGGNPVKKFFDDLAAGYDDRFSEKRPYHSWLFNERLRLATQGIDLRDAVILDIGAGTGPLYDFLQRTDLPFQYFACDLSAQMLSHSRIPPKNRFPGRITEVDLPASSFHYIFLLGVTSYMPLDELKHTLSYIENHLTPQGRAILSFTNKTSLDWRMRSLLRPFARRTKSGESVLSQPFSVSAYHEREVKALIPSGLRVEKTIWFNPLIPPFEKLMPKVWIRLAKRMKQTDRGAWWRSFLCADFLVVLKKDPLEY